MATLTLILFVLALAAFTIAAFNLAAGRLNFVAVGLALWLLAELIPRLANL